VIRQCFDAASTPSERIGAYAARQMSALRLARSEFQTRSVLLAPLVAGGVALVLAATGIDHVIQGVFYDASLGTFPARAWPWLEIVGHRLAKSLVWLVWLLLLATTIASYRIDALAGHRAVLWATTAAMAAGPALVSTLKLFTGPRCPWDLKAFGGQADAATSLLTSMAEAGRCFPSGHSAGGFSLFAVYFAGIALGDARIRRIGLWAALAGGVLFSAGMVQGAHFMSHALWSGVADWTVALLIFSLLGRGARATPMPHQSGVPAGTAPSKLP
jgi:membrane-associated PAP2 superfamily phosphatase